jgi:pimeloyl-ACP methyl ester carboxylesterase
MTQSMPVVDGQYCEVSPGISLHYASCGERDRPLMLFVHGFPEFWYAWKDILPQFGGDFFAVAPDLRGYNLSSKPTELKAYKPAELVGDLAKLIERLGNGKAIVVAHDWGGALCWSLAIARPDLVEKLVILNAPHPIPFVRALVSDDEQREASAYMNWLREPGSEAELAANGFARMETFFRKVGDALWFSGETREAYHRAWGQPGALTGGVNYYRASPLHPSKGAGDGAGKLSLNEADFTVRVPTLVIWGERDAALRPVLLEGLDRVVPDLRIERLPNATHWLVHEEPERIVAAIRAFVATA